MWWNKSVCAGPFLSSCENTGISMAEVGLVIFKLGCIECNQLVLVFSTLVIEDGWRANSVCLKLPQGRFSSPEASVDHTFILNMVIFPRANEHVLLGVWSRDLLISKSRRGYGHEACCGLWLAHQSVTDCLCRGSSFCFYWKKGDKRVLDGVNEALYSRISSLMLSILFHKHI